MGVIYLVRHGQANPSAYGVADSAPTGDAPADDSAAAVSNPGPGCTRVELERYLQGPKDANTLRVLLPGGRVVQGRIIDGCNEPAGGWLLIDVEQNQAVEQSTDQDGWKWE